MVKERSRKGREVPAIVQVNLRAGWKLVVMLMKSTSSAQVQDAVINVADEQLEDDTSLHLE